MESYTPTVADAMESRRIGSGFADETPDDRELVFVPDDTDFAAQLEQLHMQQAEDDARERDRDAAWVREALRDLAPAVLADADGSRLGTMLVRLANLAGLDRDEAFRLVCGSKPKAHPYEHLRERLVEAIEAFTEPAAA